MGQIQTHKDLKVYQLSYELAMVPTPLIVWTQFCDIKIES